MLKRLLWLVGKAMTHGSGWITPPLPITCDYGVVVDSASDNTELRVPGPPEELLQLGHLVLGFCGSSSWGACALPQGELCDGALN